MRRVLLASAAMSLILGGGAVAQDHGKPKPQAHVDARVHAQDHGAQARVAAQAHADRDRQQAQARQQAQRADAERDRAAQQRAQAQRNAAQDRARQQAAQQRAQNDRQRQQQAQQRAQQDRQRQLADQRRDQSARQRAQAARQAQLNAQRQRQAAQQRRQNAKQRQLAEQRQRQLEQIARQRNYARASSLAERRQRERIAYQRAALRVTEQQRIARIERQQDYFIRGCPPGLARQGTGCLPPGQARQLVAQRAYYNDWWRQERNAAYRYRYNDGYLYQIQPNTYSVVSYAPVLGGALSVGNPWPSNYQASPVPDYFLDYYGYDDPYDYRYADGTIYGVDPQSGSIGQIAALLTGDQWGIGQQMPAGYDIYNVPYAYRDQYYDTPESMYRYSDGYVYQVDPTTQLIQAAIQLIV